MQELEDRIRHDGIVKAGNVLKVDAFLNHQCDVELFDHMGAEWARLFEGVEINKILTIEASGIGMACIAAQRLSLPRRRSPSTSTASSMPRPSTPLPSRRSTRSSLASASCLRATRS